MQFSVYPFFFRPWSNVNPFFFFALLCERVNCVFLSLLSVSIQSVIGAYLRCETPTLSRPKQPKQQPAPAETSDQNRSRVVPAKPSPRHPSDDTDIHPPASNIILPLSSCITDTTNHTNRTSDPTGLFRSNFSHSLHQRR
ncbi:hypothetical protein CONLIGDRAFT_336637 [Coniochaeta ligniaria NRRL 30616]|uniref:Uncharacterized protein n=1 Tax=Coniochaeta ligniaria NRRL 30616 TaxID=1408157 RepID=A0A1J7IQL7_9PEZI|nr:hypothetical protein CONLIGDRAFT_336637 [Coniochaeta ligniaria NRRL 30616]